MENLEDKWKQLPLIEMEGEEITVSEHLIEEEINRGDNILAGKLLVEKTINRDIIRTTMSKA